MSWPYPMSFSEFAPILESFWTALRGDPAALEAIAVTGTGALPSAFAVTDFASAAVAVAAAAVREIIHGNTGSRPPLTVDRRLCSFWFGMSIRPQGWTLPAMWDPVTGDYRTRDGWIRIHANAPRHRAAAEKVLGCEGDRETFARAVADWSRGELERAIVTAGGCAAEMRSREEWLEHPQGIALTAEPLVHLSQTSSRARAARPCGPADRPLAGIRVLDLTRVLAGPVATRFLAGYGATVLRIDPPDWDEPGVVPEVTLGKRCARLDLEDAGDRTRFESLLRDADVLIHGYRPGALAALGYDERACEALAPGLIDVSLDAYGWSGPWSQRRGFDSLVQMSAGIAAAGMAWRAADRPTPLPVQALDHATGYLMAAAALRGLAQRLATRRGFRARLSLARTARALIECGTPRPDPALEPESGLDMDPRAEQTSWGPARRLKPPVAIERAPMHWTLPATALGSAAAGW
jgi:crotonobetainyl-CoA:carnitine CoA-transferase CaiB-like acyl-CoA transferase